MLDVELLMHNKIRNRGLAFVEMGSSGEAVQALAKLQAYEYEGQSLKLNYATLKKKKASPPVQPKPPVLFNVFVANLSFEARAKDLRELFQSSGCNVVSAEVIFHENPRRSAGYGFVSFKRKKEAVEVLSTFQGKELMGRPIKLARSRRFVKLESEINSQSEEGQDISTNSSRDSEQPKTVDSL